jgi:DNA-binding transcriptional LysR family regulator
MAMLDLELLRSFVSVVDAGGFTAPASASTAPSRP